MAHFNLIPNQICTCVVWMLYYCIEVHACIHGCVYGCVPVHVCVTFVFIYILQRMHVTQFAKPRTVPQAKKVFKIHPIYVIKFTQKMQYVSCTLPIKYS